MEEIKKNYSFYKLGDGTPMLSVWEQTENGEIKNHRIFRNVSKKTWREEKAPE